MTEKIIYEAYLAKDGEHYFLYLDEFDFSTLFDSIGKEIIQNIRLIYKDIVADLIGGCIEDKTVFDGTGIIPDIFDIMKIAKGHDLIEKIIINNEIEISVIWWEDGYIKADWDTIVRCINGQKNDAFPLQKEILNNLHNSQNIYFKLNNKDIITSIPINMDEFMNIIMDAYLEKELKLGDNVQ
jgi:hypothetical protein